MVFVWIIYLVGVLTGQDYNGNLTFDLFLARVGGPTASHATTYLIFLSIFPIAYLMLRSIIPAFLVEALAFEIHEGLWQVAYYIAWRSIIDWHVWVVENVPDTATTFATIAVLVLVYRFPSRFFVIVAMVWGVFLSAWLAIGFPVSVLSKLPNYQIIPSSYNSTLWVNQIEFFSWAYFASVILVCLWYFRPGRTHARLRTLERFRSASNYFSILLSRSCLREVRRASTVTTCPILLLLSQENEINSSGSSTSIGRD